MAWQKKGGGRRKTGGVGTKREREKNRKRRRRRGRRRRRKKKLAGRLRPCQFCLRHAERQGWKVPACAGRGGKIKQQGLQICTNLLCISIPAKKQLNQPPAYMGRGHS
ncbi:uncharacterized [Tachysurus ichikawai]